MPDWSYHPLLKPISAWLPGSARRMLALRGLQAVVSIPGGQIIPDLLGDLQPPRALAGDVVGLRLASPIGLGGGVDPDALAIGALGRFGFGFVEVGPYQLGDEFGDLVSSPLVPGTEPERLGTRLRQRPAGLSVWLRVALPADATSAISRLSALLDGVRGQIDAVCVSDPPVAARDHAFWSSVLELCADRGVRIVLIDVAAGETRPPLPLPTGGRERVVTGIAIRYLASARRPSACLDTMRAVRGRVRLVVAGCGVRSPREVLRAFNAGADLVMVDRGLIEAGPGLAKRANEALAARLPTPEPTRPGWRRGWPWSLLLGAGMAVAGVVVMAVGVTRVVLPYDETFLGVSAGHFGDINPRLLGFMRHDRITLAATLLSIGILYASLAWNGMRRGQLWARRALLASGAVGFASLFLFLGFHYVDPLHVVLSAGLFPLFLLGMILPTRPRSAPSRDLDNDRTWYLGLVGQLLLVGLGAGLLIAGITITTVGVSRVFVFADLQFLQTTAGGLATANPHLLPLIAHDRAGFGGALASDGVAMVGLVLWGFRRGERWVWWTLLVSGLAGFLGGLYAHLAVGYLEVGHLLPLFVAGGVFLLGLACAREYLLERAAGPDIGAH